MTAPLNPNHSIVTPIEDVKEGMKSLTMYYYQSMRAAGYSELDAKEHTALLLEQLHRDFRNDAQLETKEIGPISKRVDSVVKIAEDYAKANPSMRNLYEQLLSIQREINKKR